MFLIVFPQIHVLRVIVDLRDRYDRLREHAVSYLSQHYSDRAVQEALADTIEKIALGYMPHAGGVLRSLLGLRITVAPPSPEVGVRPNATVLPFPTPSSPPVAGGDQPPTSATVTSSTIYNKLRIALPDEESDDSEHVPRKPRKSKRGGKA